VPLAGSASLSGYLPLFPIDLERVRESGTKFLLLHGTRDVLVPRWIARQTLARIEGYVGVEAAEIRGGG